MAVKLRLLAALLSLSCAGAAPPATTDAVPPTLDGAAPIVIAHRGASGYVPEHTLEAYALAIEQGADFIEPDLVITRDGHLVARHDRELGRTTDVSAHPEFAGRRVLKPGAEEPDWYVEDFTLVELRTLRARQQFPGRSAARDDVLPIPTLDEVLALVRERSKALGRPIGIYPETKHPAELAALGLDFVTPLLAAIEAHGFGGPDLPVFIQSFEPGILRALAEKTDIPLIMLLEDVDGQPRIPLEEAAEFAAGVGPAKSLLVDPPTGRPSGLVARAHDLGLLVHAWTFRDDYVAPGFGKVENELAAAFAMGVDGVFADFPDTAVAARNKFITRP